ncbi:DoxX-like family protein [Marinicellulosiphila megalodicopiae]|uniref:DoxX-like family protein n=1 Tax=Marinicellulosiphila megalodicopiae TaxID=2724896 RepID=UPI003BB0E3CD
MIRFSLSFLWLFTALTSAFFAFEISLEILEQTIIPMKYHVFLIYSGSALDGIIGIWLCFAKKIRWVIYLQWIVILGFTLIISWLVPNYWLHPFGPVTKNIPIFVLCWVWLKQHDDE